jgi:predicted dehydrogenase
MPSRLRVAFAGCGLVSELHYRAVAAIPTLELIGIFDVDQARRDSRAAQWGVPAYPSLEALLAEEQLDAVLVLTSEDSHVQVATAAVEAGKHVLIEKPVSRDPREIRDLAELAAPLGVVAMPGHNYSYVPEFGRIARLVHSGKLGRVRSVFVVYAIAHPESVARMYSGVMGAVMVHHAYLVLALLGPPDRVHAGVCKTAWQDHPGEDQAWMTWSYDNGALAHLSASFAVGDDGADPWTFVVKALGTEGSATMNFRSSYVRRALGTLSFGIPAYEESYEEELRAFVAAIRDGAALPSTLEDAALCAEILRQAYATAETGGP